MLQELVGTDTNCTQMCIEPNLGISAKKTFAKGITIQSSCFYCLFTPWLGFLKSPEVNLIWAFSDDMTKILIQNIFLEKKCCNIQIQNIFLEKKMLQNSKYIPGKIDVESLSWHSLISISHQSTLRQALRGWLLKLFSKIYKNLIWASWKRISTEQSYIVS